MSSTQYVDVECTLNNLETSSLHPENVAAIRKFVDHCVAEGLSEVRQERLASALKSLVLNFAPNEFRLPEAPESDLKPVITSLNRSAYRESTKHTMRSAVKKFYKVENGGHKGPEKTKFFSVGSGGNSSSSALVSLVLTIRGETVWVPGKKPQPSTYTTQARQYTSVHQASAVGSTSPCVRSTLRCNLSAN